MFHFLRLKSNETLQKVTDPIIRQEFESGITEQPESRLVQFLMKKQLDSVTVIAWKGFFATNRKKKKVTNHT